MFGVGASYDWVTLFVMAVHNILSIMVRCCGVAISKQMAGEAKLGKRRKEDVTELHAVPTYS